MDGQSQDVPRCSRILPAIFLAISLGYGMNWHDLAAEKMMIFPAGMLFQEWMD
jgi:hypothetical protein